MEVRFFDPGTVPECTTRGWYAGRERAPHLEQAGHRGRLELAADMVRDAIRDHNARTLSDMGAGDGGLLSLLRNEIEAWGYDLMPENVEAAQNERHVNVTLADFRLPGVEYGDVAVFTEVLEHLIDPHALLRACPSRIVVASSPDGETEQAHYEFHTWGWDMAGYRVLVERAGYRVLRHESIGFQVLLAVRG